jgi:hypothetical protein
MIGFEKKYTTKVSALGKDTDLQIKVNGNEIVLMINRDTLFTILANREEIIGLINSKTKELIQQYLEKMSEAQKLQSEKGLIK